MTKGVLHLIPNILAEGRIETIPTYLKNIVTSIKIFGVEEIKSARRLLKALNKEIVIDDLQFYFINEHENASVTNLMEHLKKGHNVGYISEAGCPAIADPGQELAAAAHAQGIQVVPHVGPNSILLALMASGFNGQQFQFLGYLPIKQPELGLKIKELEQESRKKIAPNYLSKHLIVTIKCWKN
jgi:16S rRNA (cytidine1402-2'-O)-methyltransferase